MVVASAASSLLFVSLALACYGVGAAFRSFRRKSDVPHAVWLAVLFIAAAGIWSQLYGPLIGGFLTQHRLALSVIPLAAFLVYVAGFNRRFFQETHRVSSGDFLRYYVSPDVVSQLEEKGYVPLGGSHRDVTVLVTDVRNSTGMCVSFAPDVVVRSLNRYFEMVTTAVTRHGGTVDKITGDGIMAVFNAPRDLDDHAWKAFEAAREIQRNMGKLNHELSAQGLPVLNAGVGMDSGVGVLGHIGSRHFVRYTVIGDVANTASRIQEFAKTGEIALTSAAYQRVSDRVQAKPQSVEVKGKGRMSVYKVNVA